MKQTGVLLPFMVYGALFGTGQSPERNPTEHALCAKSLGIVMRRD